MGGQSERQGQKANEGNPPQSRPLIVRVFRALKRYENRRRRHHKTQHQTNELMMARWTRHVGLFTGALVLVGIVTAIIFWRQLNVMQGQLDEAKSQQLVTIAQSRANVREDRPSIRAVTKEGQIAPSGDQVGGWIISPRWINAGNTDARDWRGWFELRAFVPPSTPYKVGKKDCPDAITPNPIPDGQLIPNGTEKLQLAKTLTIADAHDQQDGKKFILIWGHMEYRDIFFPETVEHYSNWCQAIAVNDLVPDDFSFIVLRDESQ